MSLALPVLALAAVLASGKPAAAPDPALLQGEWRGAGRFLNISFDRTQGPVVIHLLIGEGGELSGTVGAATIGDCARDVRAELIEYVCTLSGRVSDQPALARKDHFVWLVVSADKHKLVSNFHLKSNPWLDLGQHIGELKADRQPADH